LLVDSLNLIILEFSTNYNIIKLSTIVCKIYQSLIDILPAYSAWILVFISAERFISIVYSRSNISQLFGTRWFQMSCLLLIFIFCFFYYSIDWLFFRMTYVVFLNDSIKNYDYMVNESIAVCFMDDNLFKINSYMNMFFSCLIPFIALITSSSLVIYSMTILRRGISQTNSAMFKKRKKRDLQFARTILLLDIIFLIFNFPFQFFQTTFQMFGILTVCII